MNEAIEAIREIARLLKESQASQYDRFIEGGARPVMAYLMVRRMGGYL